MSGVRYVAKVDPNETELPPRLTRGETGYEHEETWAARHGEWRFSHHLLDDWVGEDNYDDLIDISEPQAWEIQAAWQRKLDAETAPER